MGTIASNGRSERSARAANGMAALGRSIHDQRTARGLSLQEFATLSGVTAPALSALERGEGAAQLSTLFAAADALGSPVGSFLPGGETVADAAAAASGRPFVAAIPAPAPNGSAEPAPAAERAPRTFADLRVGALAGRAFDTLPQFAVAAVHEGRYSVAAIARVFRVPAWKLQGWVDERRGASSETAPRR